MVDLKSGLLVGLVVGLLSAGWFVRGWYDDSVRLQIEKVAEAARSATADEISKIRVENKTITAKTVEIIRKEPIYLECVADDVMMDLTNKARGY